MEFIIVSRRGNVFEYTPVVVTSGVLADVCSTLKTETDTLIASGHVIVQVIKA